jgi:hypothetical protein
MVRRRGSDEVGGTAAESWRDGVGRIARFPYDFDPYLHVSSIGDS